MTSLDELRQKLKTGEIAPEDFDKITQDDIESLFAEFSGRNVPDVPEDSKKVHGLTQAFAGVFLNYRKDYLVKMILTAMTGYLFQMNHEYERDIPEEVRTFYHDKSEDQKINTFTFDDIIGFADRIKEGAMKVKEMQEYIKQQNENILIKQGEFDSKTTDEEKTAVLMEVRAMDKSKKEAEENILCLSYIVHHNLYTYGRYAHQHLTDQLVPVVEKIPEGKKSFSKFPPPSPMNRYVMSKKDANKIVANFLGKYFKYNPREHIEPANSLRMKGKPIDIKNLPKGTFSDQNDPMIYNFETLISQPYEKDLSHGKVQLMDQEVWNYVQGNPRFGHALAAMLHDCYCDNNKSYVAHVLKNADRWRKYLIADFAKKFTYGYENVPPVDTVFKFNYYMAVNFEAIRAVTNALYVDRPEFDMGVRALKYFHGTEEEVKKQFERYTQEVQNINFGGDIQLITIGDPLPTMLGDFKTNRDRISFYNNNTKILEEILSKYEEDAVMGKKLMQKRVTTGKAEQIRKEGPDAEGLTEYQRIYGNLSAHGAKKVISQEEMKFLEESKGDYHKAVEYQQLKKMRETRDQLLEKKTYRQLTLNENRDLGELEEQIRLAEEALTVPDDTVASNIFVHDTQKGEFVKTTIYLEAETTEEIQHKKC